MNVLAALLFAHFLSDFVLQSYGQVRGKRTLKPAAHLTHGAVVLAVAFFAAWAASGQAQVGLVVAVGVLHLAQDWLKDLLRARWPASPNWVWLSADQTVHLVVIASLASLFGAAHTWAVIVAGLSRLQDPALYAGSILVLLGTWVAGVFLRDALEPLVPANAGSRFTSDRSLTGRAGPAEAEAPHVDLGAAREIAVAGYDAESAAGMDRLARVSFWIGVVERILIIASVATAGGQGLATAGLVVAAKSVFRWRELDADPRAVQYYLLGTLASVAVAVVTGLALAALVGEVHG